MLRETERVTVARAANGGGARHGERRSALGETDRVDLVALEEWLAHRQLSVEGGFQGRCNKLVDGCYSFWQGGIAVLLEVPSQRIR